MPNPSPPHTLVLARGDAASDRVLDWSRRNRVNPGVVARYAGDLTPGELAWHAGAKTPALLVNDGGKLAWVQGEQAVKDALWRLHLAASKPKPLITAYVSKTCGACQKFLNMLTMSPRLLAQTEIRTLEDDPKAVLEMHDLGAVRTPAIIVQTPQGPELATGAAALQRLIALS